MSTPTLFIVIPCYNEQEALPITARRLTALTDDMLSKELIDPASRIVLVDDGSKDGTWQVISGLHAADNRFEGVKLAHNAGHMNALWAGMTLAADRCDCVISIDADLQDDVNAMRGMLEKYLSGADVVYGVRASRETDTWFKRTTAQCFYKLMGAMGEEVVYNHADYRLLSNRALEALMEYGEGNLYLRGMVPLVGFRSTSVLYDRKERIAGKSHYPLSKMLALAFDGVTSLSIKPIRFITMTGLIISFISFIGIIWTIVSALSGHTVPGWASLACIVCFMGGIQSLFMGVIGEYVAKIYLETKSRPRYILSDRTEEMTEEVPTQEATRPREVSM